MTLDDLGLNSCFHQSRLLEVEDARIVDLEIGNAGRMRRSEKKPRYGPMQWVPYSFVFQSYPRGSGWDPLRRLVQRLIDACLADPVRWTMVGTVSPASRSVLISFTLSPVSSRFLRTSRPDPWP